MSNAYTNQPLHKYPTFEMSDARVELLKSVLGADTVLAVNVCAEITMFREADIDVSSNFETFSNNVDMAMRGKAVTGAHLGIVLARALALPGPVWPEDATHPSVFVMGIDQVAKQDKNYKDVVIYG